jgi:hypothetical protein
VKTCFWFFCFGFAFLVVVIYFRSLCCFVWPYLCFACFFGVASLSSSSLFVSFITSCHVTSLYDPFITLRFLHYQIVRILHHQPLLHCLAILMTELVLLICVASYSLWGKIDDEGMYEGMYEGTYEGFRTWLCSLIARIRLNVTRKRTCLWDEKKKENILDNCSCHNCLYFFSYRVFRNLFVTYDIFPLSLSFSTKLVYGYPTCAPLEFGSTGFNLPNYHIRCLAAFCDGSAMVLRWFECLRWLPFANAFALG